jgi:Lon-like ATP-dependent protease
MSMRARTFTSQPRSAPPPRRAHSSLVLLKKEIELCRLQADIGKRVEEKISKDQRRYFLMEQLKSIKKELGLEKDEKTALVQK